MMRLHDTNYLSFLSAILLTGSMILSSCNNDEGGMDSRGAHKLRFSVTGESISAESRAVAESGNLINSIGMSCYTGEWDESTAVPNFFYNEEIINPGTGHWETSGAFFKPAKDTKRRFYAYYPYNSGDEMGYSNFEISPADQEGYPEISYNVPFNVDDQQDFMVGRMENTDGSEKTDDVFGETLDIVKLKMYHMLTAIRFETGSVMQTGTITKIAIKGVNYKGRYTYPNISWAYVDQQTIGDFTLDLNKSVNKNDAAGTAITSDEQTFLMMPQTLNTNAYLEVTFNDGQDHVLKASLNGKIWERAKIVTYRISMSALMRLTITSSITPWDSSESLTGEVSDAANLRNQADIEQWTPGVDEAN